MEDTIVTLRFTDLGRARRALHDLERPKEALASYDRALVVRPNYLQALYNRCCVLLDLRRPEEALVAADRVLALSPEYAEALYNRGIALTQRKRF